MRRSGVSVFGLLVIALLLISSSTSMSRADQIDTYTASGGGLAAQAIFDYDGATTLTVTLKNISNIDVTDNSQVLEAVFFDSTHIVGPANTSTGADLNGSSVYYGSIVNNVGEGWVYGNPINPPSGQNTGISAAGLSGTFGSSDPFFYLPHPQGQPDGLDYGLLSAGDNPLTFTNGLQNQGPLIKSSIKFTLTTTSDFSINEIGSSVTFAYGTKPDNTVTSLGPNDVPPVPEPARIVGLASLSAMGLLGLVWYRRRDSVE